MIRGSIKERVMVGIAGLAAVIVSLAVSAAATALSLMFS